MITLKEFTIDEGVRRGVRPCTVHKDIHRGKYPVLKLKRVNARIVFVLNKNFNFTIKLIPTTRKPIAIFI